jgi:hypothetical protein
MIPENAVPAVVNERLIDELAAGIWLPPEEIHALDRAEADRGVNEEYKKYAGRTSGK